MSAWKIQELEYRKVLAIGELSVGRKQIIITKLSLDSLEHFLKLIHQHDACMVGLASD